MKCQPKIHTKSHLTFHFHFMVNLSAALILSILAGLTNLPASGEWLGLSVGTPSWWSYCFCCWCCCIWTGDIKFIPAFTINSHMQPYATILRLIASCYTRMMNLPTALILSILAGLANLIARGFQLGMSGRTPAWFFCCCCCCCCYIRTGNTKSTGRICMMCYPTKSPHTL